VLGEGSDAFRSDIHGDVVSVRCFHFPITLPMEQTNDDSEPSC